MSRTVILTTALTVALAGVASANTKQLSPPPACSVTAQTPWLTWQVIGKGSTVCATADQDARKTLFVCLQILGPDHTTWFDYGCQTYTATNQNPIWILLGTGNSPNGKHAFRFYAHAQDSKNGHTASGGVFSGTFTS